MWHPESCWLDVAVFLLLTLVGHILLREGVALEG